MKRITKNDLERIVERLNRKAGTPLEPYTDGKPNAGCYHLAGAYGGWALDQMDKVGGTGVRSVFNAGYMTKRDLYNRIAAFVAGMDEQETN